MAILRGDDERESGGNARQYAGNGAWNRVTVTPPTESKASGTSNMNSSSSGEAQKEFREIEKFTLVGEIEVEPDTKLRAKATVKLTGLGSKLSGLYYVEQVKRTWGKNGFSQTAQVSRNALGESVKSGAVEKPIPVVTAMLSSRDEPKSSVTPTVQNRTHIVKSGDTLWKIAVKYYKDGNQFTKIAVANNIAEKDYSKLQVGRKLIIP